MADPITGNDNLKSGPAGLETIADAARRAGQRGLPPVHLWNPPYCGDIGLRIARDGVWYYAGTPISRAPLVRLFSTILRKDADRYVLVTPVEKIAIDVEDAPFIAVEMKVCEHDGERRIEFRTNVDDWFAVDAGHPLRFEHGLSGGLKPYTLVRDDLWALVARPVFYDLIELGETRDVQGDAKFGIASAGQFFVICGADEIEGLNDA